MYTYNNKYQTLSKTDTNNSHGYKYQLQKAKPLIYDKNNHRYLGRTGVEWGKLIYIIYFIALY